MLKSTSSYRDVSGNEGADEENWRSSLNRTQRPQSLTPVSLQTVCQKRKNVSAIIQAKRRISSPVFSEDNDTSPPDYDDDPAENEIAYHSQENNDSSFSLSILDIKNSDCLSSPEIEAADGSKSVSPVIREVSETRIPTEVSKTNGHLYDHKPESGTSYYNGYWLNSRTPSPSCSNRDYQNSSKSLNEGVSRIHSVLQATPLVTSTPPPPPSAVLTSTLLANSSIRPSNVTGYKQFTSNSSISTASTMVNKSNQLFSLGNGYPSIPHVSSLEIESNSVETSSYTSVPCCIFPSITANSSQDSSHSFMKQLQQQLKRRSSEVFKNVHGLDSSPNAVKVQISKVDKEKSSNLFSSVSPFEPPSCTEHEKKQPVFEQEESSEKIVPTQRTMLHPSTYIQNAYYKNVLPHECLERNRLYVNSNLRNCLSDSYDNLSDTDSVVSFNSTSTASPPKRSERYSFPLTKKTAPPEVKLLDPVSRFHRSALKYSLEELFCKTMSQKVIDTHCHLDFLFQRENHKGTFSAYREKNHKDFLSSFGGCVANFIEPFFFTKKSNWEGLLKEENVWASFGVHPHFCYRYDEAVEETLLQAIKHDKVVAIGEIGLDYSTRNNCNKALQQEIFKRQVKIAVKHKMPLIIHCRDAQEDCLRILSELVPQDTKIHRHCFTGNWVEAKAWLDKFPNLYLGFTSLVTFRTVGYLHEVVRLTPTNRLLFETDAPYFVPSQVADNASGSDNKDRRFSNPGMVAHVAAQIAAIKGITDFSSFLATVRENTKKMYNI